LMLVAISSCLDELFYDDVNLATSVMIASAVFASLLVECTVRQLRIVFPMSYRLPLHAMLQWFFLFPVLIMHPSLGLSGLQEGLRVLLFPLIAALLMGLLIYAVRQGSTIVRENGTPWKWPFYPWSVFVFLLIGVAIRSYVLTLSFQSGADLSSTWAPYYLSPLVLGLGVLLHEIGTFEKNVVCRQLGSMAPLAALVLASMGGWTNAQIELLVQLSNSLASPIWLTIAGSFLCFVAMSIRGDQACALGAVGCLTALSCMPTYFTRVDQLDWQNAWPMMAAALFALGLGIRRQSSFWMTTSATLIGVVVAGFLLNDWWRLAGRLETQVLFGAGVHGWLLMCIAISIVYRDSLGAILIEELLPGVWGLLSMIGMIGGISSWKKCFLVCGCSAALVCAYAVVYVLWMLKISRATYLILGGLVSFLIGVFVSAWKALGNREAKSVSSIASDA
jgi:hypothetical protein